MSYKFFNALHSFQDQSKLTKSRFGLFLSVLFTSLVSFAQTTDVTWSFHIGNLKIIPSYPLPGEEVKVAFNIGTFQGAGYENENAIINGSEIEASVCMGIYATTNSEFFVDTISLGTLTEGTYSLRLIGRGDYGFTACDDFPTIYDSAYIDTSFVVSSKNRIDESEMGISAYPNPTSDFIRLNSISDDLVVLEVYNTSGILVLRENQLMWSNNSYEIDLRNLSSGIYHLVCVTDSKRNSLKIVKQ